MSFQKIFYWACAMSFLALAMGAFLKSEPSSPRNVGACKVVVADVGGNEVRPFGRTNAKAIVFVFVSSSCPIANRYAPEIQRLQRAYKGVHFWLVHADPEETSEEIAKNMREYRYDCGVLRDPKHQIVSLAGARVTPEAAVFLPSGELVYRGRIDNRYENFGKARAEATRHDLQDAIEAVLKGKTPAVRETRAVGCYIPGIE